MKTAVAYVRVATDTSVEGADPVQVQKQFIHRFAAKKGYDVKAVFIDQNYSAHNMDRPCLKDMLAYLVGNRVDAVLVYKRSMLARSMVHLVALEAQLKRHGASILYIIENNEAPAESRLMEALVDTFQRMSASHFKNVFGDDLTTVQQALDNSSGQETITLPYQAVKNLHELLCGLLED